MNHTQVIQHFIDTIGAKAYLEIGLGDLSNLNAIICESKVGVDPEVAPKLKLEDLEGIGEVKTEIYQMSSDKFFSEQMGAEYDVIFLDGLHHADQLWIDINNALAALNPGGVIIIHDINPDNEEMTLVPRNVKVWTGDVYKTWYRVCQRAKNAYTITLEQDFGIGIIKPEDGFKLAGTKVKDITFNEYKEWIKEQFTQL